MILIDLIVKDKIFGKDVIIVYLYHLMAKRSFTFQVSRSFFSLRFGTKTKSDRIILILFSVQCCLMVTTTNVQGILLYSPLLLRVFDCHKRIRSDKQAKTCCYLQQKSIIAITWSKHGQNHYKVRHLSHLRSLHFSLRTMSNSSPTLAIK